jgi:hypothetical protein
VRGSAATFRILVLDACRSGALTRLKGGRVGPAFEIGPEPTLEGEGMAFLTASAVDEDAQESDELKGSFFTHAFVSGLLGAADVDGDGDVVLEEAYRHAYDATLRSTSLTFAGTQHPMFQYDVRGQGAVVLSRVHRSSHAVLHFPEGTSFLVMHESRDGGVVAEVGPSGSARSLTLRPGRYFIRGRGPDELVEGDISLVAGESRDVDTTRFEHVQYAQLVRKGGRASGLSQGLELGASVRSRLPNADAPCVGPLLGYRAEWSELSVYARLTGCRGGFENEVLEATTSEVQLALYAVKAWDLRWLTLGAGLGAGAGVLHQSFESRGQAPDQLALAPLLAALVNVSHALGDGFFSELDLSGEAHWLRMRGAPDDPRPTATLSARLTLLVGVLY